MKKLIKRAGNKRSTPARGKTKRRIIPVAEFAAKSLILATPVGKLHPITDQEVEDLRVAFHVGE